MKKVVIITMVRNEEDIIESFIRHCNLFADDILVIDHDSIDSTSEILYKLREEGLPLHIEKKINIEHIQSECMTNLMHKAVKDYDADIVVPLAADEFLISRNLDITVRQILVNLSTDTCAIPEYKFILTKPDDLYLGKFILDIPCSYDEKEAIYKKILLKKEIITDSLVIGQGNHNLIDNNIVVESPINNNLVIAHFPVRGEEQILSKYVIGWIANAAKYSTSTLSATHWKDKFKEYCANGYLNTEKINCDNKIIKFSTDNSCDIKYTCKRNNITKLAVKLAKISEKLADELFKVKFLNNNFTIGIFMPISQDLSRFMDTIYSLQKQTYTKWTLWLIEYENMYCDKHILNVIDNDKRINIIKYSDLYKIDLKKVDYVQFLSIGDILYEEYLFKSCSMLEMHKSYNVAYVRVDENEWNEFFNINTSGEMSIASGNVILENCYENILLVAGYASSFFIKCDIFININNIADILKDGIINLIILYKMILSNKDIILHNEILLTVEKNYEIEALYYISLLSEVTSYYQNENDYDQKEMFKDFLHDYIIKVKQIPIDRIHNKDMKKNCVYVC